MFKTIKKALIDHTYKKDIDTITVQGACKTLEYSAYDHVSICSILNMINNHDLDEIRLLDAKIVRTKTGFTVKHY